MGVEAKVLEKSGSWYAYNGEKIGQGKDNAREFLRENPDLAVEIENKVREAMGIPLLPGARSRGAGQAEGRQGLIVPAAVRMARPRARLSLKGARAAAAGAARPEPARAARQAAAPCRGRSPRPGSRGRGRPRGATTRARRATKAIAAPRSRRCSTGSRRTASSRPSASPNRAFMRAQARFGNLRIRAELAQHGVALSPEAPRRWPSRSCNAPPRCASAASRRRRATRPSARRRRAFLPAAAFRPR